MAFHVLNNFAKDNPSFMMPKSIDKVVALKHCVQSSLSPSSTTKCMSIHTLIYFLHRFLLYLSITDSTPVAPHADLKGKKVRMVAVHPFPFLFPFIFTDIRLRANLSELLKILLRFPMVTNLHSSSPLFLPLVLLLLTLSTRSVWVFFLSILC